MKLRDYQKEMAAETMNRLGELGKGGSVMVRLPTGGGKTVIAGALLKRFHDKFPTRANAWLTHREELRDQSGASLKKMFKLKVSDMRNIGPRERTWRPGYVNLVSPQMRTMPRVPLMPGVMIVDEAHHSPATTWESKINEWRAAGGLVIGFTATVYRANRKEGFEHLYDDLILGPDFPWLEEKGFLAEPHIWAPKRMQMDVSQIRVRSTGDYDLRDMEEQALKLLAQKPVIETWIDHTEELDDKRTLWFCPTQITAFALKEHIEALTDDTAEVLIGDTKKSERRRMMAALKDKKLNHLISVDVIGEGVDIPSVPVIATIRSTKSIGVWLQQSGRGSRPKGEDGGHYILLDFASNSKDLGMPNAPREWFLQPLDDRDTGDMGGFVARCHSPECEDIMLHPSSKSCWNCGEDQYMECDECHDDRRWTRFADFEDEHSRSNTCSICVEALAEVDLKNKDLERQRRYEEAVADGRISYGKKSKMRKEAVNHVNPGARSKRVERDRMAAYISTLNRDNTYRTEVDEEKGISNADMEVTTKFEFTEESLF